MAPKLALAALCIFAFAAIASARPQHFLAIPFEEIKLAQNPAFHRLVRRAAPYDELEAISFGEGGRQFGSYNVDYTSRYGAFDWYVTDAVTPNNPISSPILSLLS